MSPPLPSHTLHTCTASKNGNCTVSSTPGYNTILPSHSGRACATGQHWIGLRANRGKSRPRRPRWHDSTGAHRNVSRSAKHLRLNTFTSMHNVMQQHNSRKFFQPKQFQTYEIIGLPTLCDMWWSIFSLLPNRTFSWRMFL